MPAETVAGYIAGFPKPVQSKLRAVRRAIRKAVPEAEESISYQIPFYRYHGRLVYFAAFKDHYSLFAVTTSALKKFEKKLSRYKQSGRGTVQFPLDEPVPEKLIADVTKFRANENIARERKKP